MTTRAYRQTARAEATERTRRAILDAAEAVFVHEGRYDLSLDEVAARAGVSTRTVLRHFGSREGLFEAGVRDARARVTDERRPVPGDVGATIARLVDHYERVGAAVVRMLAAAEQLPLVARVTDDGAAQHRRWVEEAFAADLDGLPAARRDERVALLATVTDVYVWSLLRHRHGLDRDRTEAAIHALVDHARGATP